MSGFEPLRTQTFPYSQDVALRLSSYEGPEDNDVVYNERTHPGGYHAMSPPEDTPFELEADYDDRPQRPGYNLMPPPTAASEDSRVTLFYHGYTTDENRHWVDDEVLSSGDETVRNDRDEGYTDRTPMVMEAALPSGSPNEPEPEQEKDSNLISWTGPDDPLHPHNWCVLEGMSHSTRSCDTG